MSFVKDSLSVFSTRVLLFLVGIGGGILIARILGPTGRGTLSVIILFPTLVASIGHLGIGNANLYFIGKQKFPFQSILSNSLIVSITLGGFLILFCLGIVSFLRDTIFQGIDWISILIATAIIPFTILTRYTSYIFLGKLMIRERNLVNLLLGFPSFICVVLFVVFLGLGIKGALIAPLGGLLVGTTYSLYRLRKMGRLTLHFDYRLFKASVGYGVKSYLALIILSLNYKLDIFLIKYFLTNTEVGYYALASSIVDKLWYLPRSIGMITLSRVASLNTDQANKLTLKVCRNTLLAFFIIGTTLFWAGRFLIPLAYGKAYMPSVNAFAILLPGVLAMSIKSILNSDLTGRGRPEITIYVFSAALILNIVLNLLLIPRMGIEGAALASTVSYIAGSAALGYVFSRLTHTKLRDLILIQRSDIQDYQSLFATLKSKVFGPATRVRQDGKEKVKDSHI